MTPGPGEKPRRFSFWMVFGPLLLLLSGLLWRRHAYDDPPTLPSQTRQEQNGQTPDPPPPVRRGPVGRWIEDRTGLLGLLD